MNLLKKKQVKKIKREKESCRARERETHTDIMYIMI